MTASGTFWRKFARAKRGATAIEYGFLLALIAITLIGDDSALQSLGTGPLSGEDKKLLGLTSPPVGPVLLACARSGKSAISPPISAAPSQEISKPGRASPLEFDYTFLKVVNTLLTTF